MDSGCHCTLPLNHCVCVLGWDPPFQKGCGQIVGSPAPAPLQLRLSPVLSPQTSCLLRTRTSRSLGGWVGVGERGSHSHTEGAQGGPDSRSVTVPLLWGGGSRPLPLTHPLSPSVPPHPLPGSGRSEHLETGWLTDALPSTSASKPTTHSCSRADESSCSNHQAMAQKAKQTHRQQIGYRQLATSVVPGPQL